MIKKPNTLSFSASLRQAGLFAVILSGALYGLVQVGSKNLLLRSLRVTSAKKLLIH
jgi:hypothetical protein